MPLPTLRDALCEIGAFELAHIAAIHIAPGDGGYQATVSIHAFLPVGEAPSLPAGVSVSGFEPWPDRIFTLDWRTSAWEQVLEAIRDPWLTDPRRLGNCEAAESTPAGDHPGSGKRWMISTHGLPHSADRFEWLQRLEVGYSHH